MNFSHITLTRVAKADGEKEGSKAGQPVRSGKKEVMGVREGKGAKQRRSQLHFSHLVLFMLYAKNRSLPFYLQPVKDPFEKPSV